MVTAKTSKIDLPPENSRRYIFSKDLELEIRYDDPMLQAKYNKLFGGNER